MTSKTLAASAILLSIMPVRAGTTVPSLTHPESVSTTAPVWQCRAALYGWGTALDGDVTIHGRNVPVDLGFSDILDKLDVAAMGAVEVSYGKWSFLADLFYAELSSSSTRTLSTVDLEMTQFIGNFIVAYNVIGTAPTRFDVYAGARVNSIHADLDIDIGKIGAFSGSASKTWVDPIIGVRFQQNLSEKFFFRTVGDIGGFSISSDFTWQALAAIGYRTSDSGSVLLGYRGIGTDYADGDFGYDVVSHGLILGFEYKF